MAGPDAILDADAEDAPDAGDVPDDLPNGACDGLESCTTLDAFECSANGVAVRTCVDHGGCLAWSAFAACDDGDACTGTEFCDAGNGCQSTSPVTCDDGDPCTQDLCSPESGICSFPPVDAPLCCTSAADCDDGDPCTIDACELNTCTTAADTGAICDDGDPCTANDVCHDDAVCGGMPIDPICCECIFGWAATVHSSTDGQAVFVGSAILPDGTVYAIGRHDRAGNTGDTVISHAGGVFSATWTNVLQGGFVTRFSPGGTMDWFEPAGGIVVGQNPAAGPTRLVEHGDALLISGILRTSPFSTIPLDFGTGPDAVSFIDATDSAFIARYLANGDVDWVIAHTNGGAPGDLATAPDGRFAITGHAGDLNIGGVDFSSDVNQNGTQGYVALFDSTAAVEWAVIYGTAPTDEMSAVDFAADGDVLVGGHYVTADQVILGQTLLGSAAPNANQAFVLALLPGPQIHWLTNIFGDGNEWVIDVAGIADGGAYVAVNFDGTIDFTGPTVTSLGAQDAVVGKLDDTGNAQWIRQMRAGSEVALTELGARDDGGFVVTGWWQPAGSNTLTVGHGASNPTVLTSAGETDAFVAAFDASGDVVWARLIGGVSFETSTGVSALGGSGVVVSGTFVGPADVFFNDDASPVSTLIGSGAGPSAPDGFLLRTGVLQP